MHVMALKIATKMHACANSRRFLWTTNLKTGVLVWQCKQPSSRDNIHLKTSGLFSAKDLR
jgi:hypothetical protein